MQKPILRICLALLLMFGASLTNAQFITTTDNENDFFTGGPDGDMDVTMYMFNNPIEFSINTTGTPLEQVKLAINAYDVDELEDVNVKFNGTYIGKLRGRNKEWIVSMLNVPLNLWIEGRNTVEIYYLGGSNLAPKLKVDWGQLIVDGGTRSGAQINNFELDRFSFYEEGFFNIDKWRLYNTLDVSVSSGTYSTQIQLIEFGIYGNEQFVSSSYGAAASSQVATMTLNYRNDKFTKYLTCRALLINNSTQEVVDYTEFRFHHTQYEGPDPFYMELSNSTNAPTQSNITITCTKFKNYNNLPFKHIILPDGSTTTNTAFSYTATTNNEYSFTIISTDAESYTFKHNITHIDRTPPTITLYGNASEELTEEGTYIDAGAKAFDSFSGDISGSITTVNNVDPFTPGDYIITYNVTDPAGNQASQIERHVTVLNKPLEVNTTSPTQSPANIVFNGNLLYLGSTPVTEHGFVWSLLPNPSLDANLGSCQLGSIFEKATFQYSTNTLEMGAIYHVRSYATNTEGTVYGNDVEFTYNGINYGTIGIENISYAVNEGSSASINILRTGGSEGAISLNYKTLNGNAFGGVQFTSASGTLNFADGETSKTITINTSSNSAYTGDKRFYLKLENISNGAFSRDQCFVKILDLQTKPVYILGSNVVTHGTGDNGFRQLGQGVNGYQGWSSPNSFESISGNFYNSAGDFDDSYFVYFDQDNLDIKDLASNGEIRVDASLRTRAEGETNNDGYRIEVYVGDTKIGGKEDGNYNSDWVTLSTSDNTYIRSSNYIRLRCDGWITGTFDDDLNVYYDDLSVSFTDIVAPTITQVASNTGDYIYNDKIYIAVSMSERVKASNAQITLNTGNTTNGTAFCIDGGETDCLLFEYSVREGDNQENIVVTGISGVTDYQPNNLDASALPYTLAGVNVDGILPSITLTDQGTQTDYANSHAIKIEVSNSDSQKYTWSNSETMPAAGWTSFNSGDIVTIATGDEDWYLHVYSSRDNGNSKYIHSAVVNLDNTVPTLTLTPSTTDWVNTTVTITATVSDLSPKTLTDPDGQSTTLTTTTYSVSENGTYSFTATDEAGNSNTRAITVTNIETTPPTINLSNNGSDGSWVDVAKTVVTVEDSDSGINEFEYVWDSSPGTPVSGWQMYSGTAAYLSDASNGNRYLHIRATDNVGNTAVFNSSVFYIDNVKPELTLSYTNLGNWINTSVTVNISASKTSGQLLDKIILPDNTEITATSGEASTTFIIEENGLYEFSAIDLAGNFTDKEILINKIDKEVPVLMYSLSEDAWTNQDVTMAVSLNDDNSSLYDSNGRNIGYGSSGVLEIKEGSGNFISYSSPFSKTFTSNSSVRYEAKDALGNNIIQTIEITNIDKSAPTITASSNNNDWRTTNFQISLTYSDSQSGMASSLYAVSNSTSVPSSFSNYSGPIDFSSEGVFYLHYEGTDIVGNNNSGYFGPYKLDKSAPSSFTANASNFGTTSITISGTSSDAASGLHDTESYRFALDGTYGSWQTGNSYNFTSLTPNASYNFKMMTKDNAGLTKETNVISKYTLALNPEVEVLSSTNAQLEFKVTHNIANQSVPYCYYELKEMGGGASAANVAAQGWTLNSTITFTGLTAGVHYELWVTARNGDSVENSKFKAVANAVTNRPPIANNENYIVYNGHQLVVPAAKGVLANDSDPDGNTITAVLQSGPSPSDGTLNFYSDGSFTFTPANDFLGNATFTYRVNDGFVDSENIATATINVAIPTWNGTGEYTNPNNWSGNEVPRSTDNIIIESGTMYINSQVQFEKITITGGNVLVQNGAILTLGGCDYSGNVLRAKNGSKIQINGNIYSNGILRLKISSGLTVSSGIKL